MSYDIHLVIDTGGEYAARVTECRSPTYNLGPMFALALGHPIRDLAGQLAKDVTPTLQAAIKSMKAKPAKFKKLNPANGWGSYEGAVSSLEWLLEVCKEHPLATVEI